MSFFFRGHKPGLSTNRIEAFSDGVFAIAITLLVLEIAVPELSSTELHDGLLLTRLIELWPKILSYIVSFAIIGIFWMGHHIMFDYIKRSDRVLMWLNMLLLMLIAFIPFPAALIGEYTSDPVAVMVYGGVLLLVSLMFNIIWYYASSGKRLVDKDLDRKIIKKANFVLCIAPIFYLLALIISFFYPTISVIMYILVPVFYILPGPVDDLVTYQFKD